MNYYAYQFTVSPLQPGSDILIALLSDCGFESFVNTNNGFEAFVQGELLNEEALHALEGFDFSFSFSRQLIEQKNWNEEWERNFHPVYVEDKCCIRAPFHPDPEMVQQDIVIQPKMSFGTGHHDTTWLMCRELFEMDMQEKIVLDMGCGTGVLAILSEKRGAAAIDAIDIDVWSYENALENCEVNDCTKITVMQGDCRMMGTAKYHVLLANINRNILIQDMEAYYRSLRPGGIALFSGFFESDIPELTKCAQLSGFQSVTSESRNNWALLKFQKSTMTSK